MQFFTETSRNTQLKSYMLSLTEFVWDFQNKALWDTIKTMIDALIDDCLPLIAILS